MARLRRRYVETAGGVGAALNRYDHIYNMTEATTYLGYRIECSPVYVIAYTPDGHELTRTESMAKARKAVRDDRREQRLTTAAEGVTVRA